MAAATSLTWAERAAASKPAPLFSAGPQSLKSSHKTKPAQVKKRRFGVCSPVPSLPAYEWVDGAVGRKDQCFVSGNSSDWT